MKTTKKSIKNMIGQGKLAKALDALKQFAQQEDEDIQNTILLQSARFESLKKDEINGIITFENASRVRAQITYAVLSIMDDFEEPLEELTTEPIKNIAETISEKSINIGEGQIRTKSLESKSIKEVAETKTDEKDEEETKESKYSSTILFVAANPKDSDYLRLGEEYSKIAESLRLSDIREEIQIEQQWAVEVKDFRRAMLRHKPYIVHFSGHGSSDGGIMLEDSEGYGKPIDIKALGDFFAFFKDSIKCVLLNSCYSEPQAIEISKSVPYVIGVKDDIPDETSIAFAEAFYDALGASKSIEDAFSFARNNIAMSGLDGKELPVLLSQ